MPPEVRIRPARAEDGAACAAIYAPFVSRSMVTFAYERETPTAEDFSKRIDDLTSGGFPFLVCEVDEEATVQQGSGEEGGSGAGASAASASSASANPARVVGYAYVGPFRPRAGWRFTVEDSIYLSPEWRGRGLGRRLLAALLDGCRAGGRVHSVVAGISVDEGAEDVPGAELGEEPPAMAGAAASAARGRAEKSGGGGGGGGGGGAVDAQSKAGAGRGTGAASVALHAAAGFVECGRIREAGWKFGRWCDCVFMQLHL